MTAVLVIIAVILGLAVGSFVNVVAHRVPVGVSVIDPPSACPECGHRIRPRDNIPVAGWLLLRGRCRHCSTRISARYPVVEGITAAAFGLTAGLLGLIWVLPAYLWFVGVTITLVLTDLDHKRIPNRILFPGLIVATPVLGLGSVLDGDISAFWRALAGAGIYFALLLVIALVARGGFGFGDVKLAALLGLFTAHVGWSALGFGVFAAFAFGGLASVLLLVLRRVGRKDSIPFGPPMILGAYTALLWGERVVDWYLT